MKANTKEKKPIIIAVDQGNASFKTQNTIIPTHVYERLDDDILDDGRRRIEYEGTAYIETSRTIPQSDNKANEKFRVLTMISMAEEILATSGKQTKTIEETIILLLGVPNDPSFKNHVALNIQKYYGNPKLWEFDYRNHHFKLTVVEVCIYRQGKAIMDLVPINKGKATIVDVGGQTTDVINYDAESKNVIYSGMLDRSGMKGLIRTVASRISTLDDKVRTEDFQEFLLTGKGLSKEQTEKTKTYIKSWIEDMVDSISEEICEGLPARRWGKIYLAGGGASVLEPYLRSVLSELGVQDGDVKLVQDAQTANARAYVQIKRKSMAMMAKK